MGLVDKALDKAISKKLLVWLLTTVMFFMKMVSDVQWFEITKIWMGGVVLIDTVKMAVDKFGNKE